MNLLKVKSLEWYDTMHTNGDNIYRTTNNDKGKYRIEKNVLIIDWEIWGEERFVKFDINEYYKEHYYKFKINLQTDTYFDEAELDIKDKSIYLKNMKKNGKYRFNNDSIEIIWRTKEKDIFYMYEYGKLFCTRKSSKRSYNKKIIKNIAILFPQFHEIIENNQFWGKGFTEWTLLKKMPDNIENQVIRHPHNDIGYYNLKDREHRRFIENIANKNEIHGFCYYHYWFKNKKIMYEPLELMLSDGHPDLPFMFCWANEQWTKRWDGGNNEVLIEQDYDDEKGNKDHFNYLLKFFRHKNYIKIKNKPVFIFYRLEKKDKNSIEKIINEWNKLAQENGLSGIHFMRFYGPFDNSIEIEGIEGYVNFEPGYTTQIHGNDIVSYNENNLLFNNIDDFNEEEYLNKNIDVKNVIDKKQLKNGLTHYKSICERERLIRTSKFNVHDGDITLNKIKENKIEKKNQHLGIFVGWNNFPRRNYTNKKYDAYPLYYKNVTNEKFGECYLKLLDNIQQSSENDVNFLFLTSWNEWNEQSSLEPNHYDGYNYLTTIKNNYFNYYDFGKTKNILTICHKGGGTEKYLDDLKSIFLHYNFINYEENEDINKYKNMDIDFIHINSFFTMNILHDYLGFLINNFGNVKKILTIHDYQWLYPNNPNILSYNMNLTNIDLIQKNNVLELISLCDHVIFPSYNILKNYNEYLELENIENKIVVIPHCDKLVIHNNLVIPEIKNTINIAFIGNFIEYKGSMLYKYLFNNIKYYNGITLTYHVFGYLSNEERSNKIKDENFIYHGEYIDENIIKKLYEYNIHVLTYLSLFEESYCYSLTQGINSGIPILYLNHGAFTERLKNNEKYISSSVSELISKFEDILIYVNHNKNTKNIYNSNNKIQPSKWYINNY